VSHHSPVRPASDQDLHPVTPGSGNRGAPISDRRAALAALDAQMALEASGPYVTSLRARLAAWGGR
jgi:hypothetical protein